MLRNELSSLRLTKIVTVLPYFVVINFTAQPLRYMEDNEQADLWFDIAPKEVLQCAFMLQNVCSSYLEYIAIAGE